MGCVKTRGVCVILVTEELIVKWFRNGLVALKIAIKEEDVKTEFVYALRDIQKMITGIIIYFIFLIYYYI